MRLTVLHKNLHKNNKKIEYYIDRKNFDKVNKEGTVQVEYSKGYEWLIGIRETI